MKGGTGTYDANSGIFISHNKQYKEGDNPETADKDALSIDGVDDVYDPSFPHAGGRSSLKTCFINLLNTILGSGMSLPYQCHQDGWVVAVALLTTSACGHHMASTLLNAQI